MTTTKTHIQTLLRQIDCEWWDWDEHGSGVEYVLGQALQELGELTERLNMADRIIADYIRRLREYEPHQHEDNQ